MKYTERITLNKEDKDKDKQESQWQNAEASLQLDADLLATQRALSTVRRELDDLKSAFPFSAKAIVSKQDEVSGLEAGQKALTDLKAELF